MITLNQIPGFADLADANFAAGAYASGFNFQRLIDNAKFGMVRPEIFVGSYQHGGTVNLPTSPVDGYTYERTELNYLYHLSMSGANDPTALGKPSGPGGMWYFSTKVDQTTGDVFSYIKYSTSDHLTQAVMTNDGVVEVFTIATRRRDSLIVSAVPSYVDVADSELYQDAAVTQSIMQRLNRNSKVAALSGEAIYMGEFTNGTTIPRPVSPADGYTYAYSECHFMASWRWSTQGDSFGDPVFNGTQMNLLNNFSYGIDQTTGGVSLQVTYNHSREFVTNHGRIAVVAFCKRSPSITAPVNFVDLTPKLFQPPRPVRYDVMQRANQNIKYSICRPEFFQASYANGSTVALPTSLIDGYVYARAELTYIFDWLTTAPASVIRISSWKVRIDQATGAVSISLTRVADGGGLHVTADGHIWVTTIARRSHVTNTSDDWIYDGGNGSGLNDATALQNGGFDRWTNASRPVADAWQIYSLSGSPIASQSPGLVAGYSQRLSVGPGETLGIESSKVKVKPGEVRLLAYVRLPNIPSI